MLCGVPEMMIKLIERDFSRRKQACKYKLSRLTFKSIIYRHDGLDGPEIGRATLSREGIKQLRAEGRQALL